MGEKVNLNRGAKIEFAPCSDPYDVENVVKDSDGIKILKCRQHGGYYISVWGSSGGAKRNSAKALVKKRWCLLLVAPTAQANAYLGSMLGMAW